MKRILYYIQILINYYLKFGFSGILLLIKRAFYGKRLIQIKIPSYKHTFYLRNKTSDTSSFNQIFFHGEYDTNFNIVPKTIVDCGANIGLSAVYFANKFPNSKIIALEPEMSNFEIMVKNTECYPNITCINKAIWDKACNLKIVDMGYENWGFLTIETEGSSENTVAALSISDIIKIYKISKIDILKVDIEGAEKELFSSISDDTLQNINVLIIEFHDRIKKNTAKTFFNSVKNFDYNLEFKGEYVICSLNN